MIPSLKAWRQIRFFLSSFTGTINVTVRPSCKKRNGERILRNKIIQKSLTSRCMLCIGYLMTTTCAASKTFIISCSHIKHLDFCNLYYSKFSRVSRIDHSFVLLDWLIDFLFRQQKKHNEDFFPKCTVDGYFTIHSIYLWLQ